MEIVSENVEWSCSNIYLKNDGSKLESEKNIKCSQYADLHHIPL